MDRAIGYSSAGRIIPDCLRAIEAGPPIDIRSPKAIRPWQYGIKPLDGYMLLKNDERLKLFIQFGRSEEYDNNGSPFVETMREEPNSPYALVKQLTTNTALMLYCNYGFPVMVVRSGNLFGSGQLVEVYSVCDRPAQSD